MFRSIQKIKRAVSMLLCFAMLFSVVTTMPLTASASDTTTFTHPGYKVEYKVVNEWNNGNNQNIEVKITNTGTDVIENWMLAFDFMGTPTMHSGGTIFTGDNVTYVKNTGTNLAGTGDSVNITPNQSVQFGYALTNPTGTPDSFELRQERVALIQGVDYEVEMVTKNNYGSSFQGDILIHNLTTQPLEAWELTFSSSNFVLQNSWERLLTNHGNGRYSIKPVAGNIFRIGANSTLTLGFQADKANNLGLNDLEITFETLTSVVFGNIIVIGDCVNCNQNPCICIEVCDICNQDPCECEEIVCNYDGSSRFGGTIAPPSGNYISFANANAVGSSGRGNLEFNVLDLIESTAIKANDIYGFKVITWGANVENRQAFIDVRTNGTWVSSPRFHGGSDPQTDWLWAIMSHGNPPIRGQYTRTEQNTLNYMNQYGGNPKVASNVVALTPFVDTENPTQFDVRIRPNDSHASLVTAIILLDLEGDILGATMYSTQNANGTWSQFISLYSGCVCGECVDGDFLNSLVDSDEDGLPDIFEIFIGTNHLATDTDGDGLPDGYEVNILNTDPLKVDTDDNGIWDCDEDFDEDGLTNLEEYLLGTNPLKSDTDNDKLSDYDEVHIYETDPLNPDTDGDTLTDYEEVLLSLDPNNPVTDGITHDSLRTFYQVLSDGSISEELLSTDNWLIPSISGEVFGLISNRINLDTSLFDAFNDSRALISPVICVETKYEIPLNLTFSYAHSSIGYSGNMNNLFIF